MLTFLSPTIFRSASLDPISTKIFLEDAFERIRDAHAP